jgi:Nickel insertion protein
MVKEGVLILVQLDRLTGEDIGWALESLAIPGVRNRNLVPTLTKKGRTGYLLFIDAEADAEEEVGRFLMENLDTYGYHRIKTEHVHLKTVTKTITVLVSKEGQSIEEHVRLKGRGDCENGPFFVESDDLFSLQARIVDELGDTISPNELRRTIEGLWAMERKDVLVISR